MNVLILHNSYQRRGGEDAVVEAEAAMLRAAGHRVSVEIVSNAELCGLPSQGRAFLRAAFDPEMAKWVTDLVRGDEVEVVHVHNFFPLLTPAVHEGAARAGAAVVQTLHNYRLLCANGLFLRNGRVCEKCLNGPKSWGLVHRCYRGSLPASVAVTRMQMRAARMGTWQRNVHRFIALTPFAREKFVAGGLPRSRISVKPNFVSALPPQRGRAPRGALYVGRLSMEKGVRVLLNAWRELPEIPLTIIGDGPERSALQASAPPNVTFRGALPGAVVREQMEAAACLIVPSIWYEGFPMTVVEAFAAGLPVIASRIGSLTDIVEDGKTGRLFAAGDPLALTQVVREYFSQGQHVKLSAAARMEYESRFTPQINLAELTAIYDGAIAEACEFVVSSERR